MPVTHKEAERVTISIPHFLTQEMETLLNELRP